MYGVQYWSFLGHSQKLLKVWYFLAMTGEDSQWSTSKNRTVRRKVSWVWSKNAFSESPRSSPRRMARATRATGGLGAMPRSASRVPSGSKSTRRSNPTSPSLPVVSVPGSPSLALFILIKDKRGHTQYIAPVPTLYLWTVSVRREIPTRGVVYWQQDSSWYYLLYCTLH